MRWTLSTETLNGSTILSAFHFNDYFFLTPSYSTLYKCFYSTLYKCLQTLNSHTASAGLHWYICVHAHWKHAITALIIILHAEIIILWALLKAASYASQEVKASWSVDALTLKRQWFRIQIPTNSDFLQLCQQ